MQVHVAANSLPDDTKAKRILNRALELMSQVTEEGRNALRGLRTSASPSLELEQAFAQVKQEYAVQAKAGEEPGFRVVVEGSRQPLHPLLRDDIYRIGREALLNAFRHAQARNVEVELSYSPRQLRVQVSDDGRGIDPQILNQGRDGHFGLPGMRERAEQIGARLRVYSSAAAGTRIELCVPGHVAFQGRAKRSWWFGGRSR
jgi:signal transduction histidine kinase